MARIRGLRVLVPVFLGILAGLPALAGGGLSPIWTYNPNATILFPPTVGGDGSVYFATSDSHIRGLSPSGGLLWSVDPGGLPSTGMALDGNLLLFSTSQGELNAYGLNGHLAWRVPLYSDIRAIPAVAADGTIYLGTVSGTFCAISPSGGTIWSVKTGEPILLSAVVAHSGTIFVSSYTHLWAFSPHGALLWSRPLAKPLATPIALDGNDDLYYIDSAGAAWSLNPNGTKRWMAPGSSTLATSASSPVVSQDAVLFNATLSTPPAATYTVSGTITLSGGGALQGATVTATGGSSSPSATTDSSGSYTITGLADGTYTLTPTLSGYAFTPATASVTVSGADVTGQNFTASLGYSISGTVTLSGGSGLAGVTLSTGTGITATTDSSGNYTLSPLPVGVYTVTPALAGYTFSPASLSVTIVNTNVEGQNFTASTSSAAADSPGAEETTESTAESTTATYQFGAYSLADGTALWPALAIGSDSAPALASDGTAWVPSAGDQKVYQIDTSSGSTVTTLSAPAVPQDMVLADTSAGPRLCFVAGTEQIRCYAVSAGPDGTAPWSQLGAGPRHLFRRDDPPAVTITEPASGAVSGDVAVSADVTDDFPAGMAVRFLVDGTPFATLSASPYTATWYSQAATDGTHTLSVQARDSAGNVSQADVQVTSSNPSGGFTVYADSPPAPFSWQAGSETAFRVEFSLSTSFSSLLTDSRKPGQPWLKKASWRPGQAKWKKILLSAKDATTAPTTVYWRVVGKSGGGALGGGTLTIAPPIPPDGLQPPDGTPASSAPSFSWNPEHSARFRVEASHSADFSTGVVLSSRSAAHAWLHKDTWTPGNRAWNKATSGTSTLYWRVVARDALGRETTSAVSSLSIYSRS